MSVLDETVVVFYIFFFFSSRRRHTRFDCDWSSDVCSSDLGASRPPSRLGRSPAPRRSSAGSYADRGDLLGRQGEVAGRFGSGALVLERRPPDRAEPLRPPAAGVETAPAPRGGRAPGGTPPPT